MEERTPSQAQLVEIYDAAAKLLQQVNIYRGTVEDTAGLQASFSVSRLAKAAQAMERLLNPKRAAWGSFERDCGAMRATGWPAAVSQSLGLLAAGSGDLLRAMGWQGFCEGKSAGLLITPDDAELTTEQVGEAEVVSVGRSLFHWPMFDEKVSARFQAALTLLRETLGMRPTPVGAWFVPTNLQADILDALDGRALKKDALAVEVCGGEGTRLYKPGAIKELRGAGLVAHRKGVGYYRPDAPPSGSVWLRN